MNLMYIYIHLHPCTTLVLSQRFPISLETSEELTVSGPAFLPFNVLLELAHQSGFSWGTCCQVFHSFYYSIMPCTKPCSIGFLTLVKLKENLDSSYRLVPSG